MRVRVEFICPSCGAPAMVIDDPNDEQAQPQLLHKMPQCERFRLVDSPQDWIDYLRDARTASQN